MIGIFIIARLGSQRLPQKHLIEANGKMFIKWEIERFYDAFKDDLTNRKAGIFIVTSSNPENKQFEILLAKSHPYVKVFYGSDGNIPLRQTECAIQYGIDHIISVDGDDVLCSTLAAKTVANELVSGGNLVKTAGLPLGMNIMGFSSQYLKVRVAPHKQKEKLETGWGKIFPENEFKLLSLANFDKDTHLRFTLDYEQDRLFFETIINHFGEGIIDISDGDLIDYVVQNKVYALNADLNEQYMQNFNTLKNKE